MNFVLFIGQIQTHIAVQGPTVSAGRVMTSTQVLVGKNN